MSATLAAAQPARQFGVPPDCPLSSSEFTILRALAAGIAPQQIARDMGRSVSTIRTHLSTAYHRLGVTTAAGAVAHCCAAGWIGRDDPDINRLAVAVDRLATAVTSEEKSTLTAEQRSFLHAFEDYLYASTGDEKHAARMRMNVTGRRAGITPHPERGRPELMDVLVSLVKSGWTDETHPVRHRRHR